MRRNEDYIVRKIAGEVILIPSGGAAARLNGMVSLNELAAFLWEQLKEPRDLEELIRLVTGEYEVSREEAEKDIREFIARLKEEGMVIN